MAKEKTGRIEHDECLNSRVLRQTLNKLFQGDYYLVKELLIPST